MLRLTAVKVALFIALMLVVGRRRHPVDAALHRAHRHRANCSGSACWPIALGVAFGATKLFDVSLALGAFFAGMMLGDRRSASAPREETAAAARRLRRAVLRLGRHAVRPAQRGPRAAGRWSRPLLVIIIGKSLAAFLIVLAFRHPVATALTISASLAQIGEFSFILAELGVALEPALEQAAT